jgi:hypothetical protein
MTAGSTLDFDLDRPGVAGQGINDLLAVQGGVVLDGRLTINPLSHFGPGTYTLMTYGGTATYRSLCADGLPPFVCPSVIARGDYFRSSTLASGLYGYALEFAPGSAGGPENVNLVVSLVPEPSTVALSGAAVALLAWFRGFARSQASASRRPRVRPGL